MIFIKVLCNDADLHQHTTGCYNYLAGSALRSLLSRNRGPFVHLKMVIMLYCICAMFDCGVMFNSVVMLSTWKC